MSINKDYFIPDPIDDTIQCMKFIPIKNEDYLATGGWDSKFRVFNINYNIINNNQEAQISSKLEFGFQQNSNFFLYLGKEILAEFLQDVPMVR